MNLNSRLEVYLSLKMEVLVAIFATNDLYFGFYDKER
jgi:hypothetical protein